MEIVEHQNDRLPAAREHRVDQPVQPGTELFQRAAIWRHKVGEATALQRHADRGKTVRRVVVVLVEADPGEAQPTGLFRQRRKQRGLAGASRG
jgi:hypothetical protein